MAFKTWWGHQYSRRYRVGIICHPPAPGWDRVKGGQLADLDNKLRRERGQLSKSAAWNFKTGTGNKTAEILRQEMITKTTTLPWIDLTIILTFVWHRDMTCVTIICPCVEFRGPFINYVVKILAFFDHLPPCVDILYCINVEKKGVFMDHLLPKYLVL